jgi:hypothetical protein
VKMDRSPYRHSVRYGWVIWSGRACEALRVFVDKYLVSVRALRGSMDGVVLGIGWRPHLGFILGWCGTKFASVQALALRMASGRALLEALRVV